MKLLKTGYDETWSTPLALSQNPPSCFYTLSQNKQLWLGWNQSATNATLSILFSGFLWLLNTGDWAINRCNFQWSPIFFFLLSWFLRLSQLSTMCSCLDRNSGPYWAPISVGQHGLNLLPCCSNKLIVALFLTSP